MPTTQVIVLAIIQGLTEFFPVSSSAHLILTSRFLGWPDAGLFMDVAVHIGTLGAIMVYFASDVGRLIRGFFDLCRFRLTSAAQFFLNLSLATLPLVCVGFFVDRFGGDHLRTLEGLGWTTLIFGLFLYVADHFFPSQRSLRDIPPRQAFWGWGMAQILALIHGASRSGVCMTFGRLMGYQRTDVARVAFLMAIPAITAAGTLKMVQFCCVGDWTLLKPAGLGMLVSFITGLCAIRLLMLWLRSFSLTIFVIYRILLGVGLLGLVYL